MEYWYRYHHVLRDNGYATHYEITLHEFKVLRKTPKGVWINDYGKETFVLNGSRKQYASPTKEKAFECFKARKARHLRILNSQQRLIEDLYNRIKDKDLPDEQEGYNF